MIRTRLFARLAPAPVLLAGLAAHAETPATVAPAGPSLLPLLTGFILVLALIPAAAWLMRRSGLAQRASASDLRVTGQLALGPRERLVIVETGERRLLLGVSAAGITRLGTLPPQAAPAETVPPAPGAGRFADLIKRFTPAP
jgi:flagellar protein FliO/FliZ